MVELSEEMKQNQNIQVNARVKIQGFYGTIKYVGFVENHPGLWVGIEWDDVSRGKHDGIVNGVRYFKTSHPYSGSMVRIEKINQFQTLEEAIFDRYYEKNENVVDEFLMKETQQFMHAPLLEVVGMDKLRKKQSHLGDLVEISVSGTNVNFAGNLGQFKNVTNLDLSSTLIWKWKTVADITRQLTSLKYISLANNQLELPSKEDVEELRDTFWNLKGINLRNCGIDDWSQVVQIARLWPNIESLSLQDNRLRTIEKLSNQKEIFLKLESLDLLGNELENFDDVCHLGHLKTLKELLMSGNKFKKVRLPECSFAEKLDIFVALEAINLRDNPIEDDFECFNEIDKLASLKNLSYSTKNSSEYDDMAYKAIALIGGLKYLNKRKIESSDRRNTEYDLWKQHAQKWIDIQDDEIGKVKFMNKCRAYPGLVRKYGLPDIEIIRPAVKPKNLYKIKIQHKKSNKKIDKKLPAKLSTQALYGLVSKLFGEAIIGNDFKICLLDPMHTDIRVDIEMSSKTLDFYSIKDDDVLLVE